MGTNFSDFILENYTFAPLKISLILLSTGVYQITKTAPKAPAKWHNRTSSYSAPHHIVQCGLWFYNKKTAQTALHRILSIY